MRGGATRICEIAFDADVEYYNLNGSSVANTVNDIESIMNGVESIYENNTGVTFEVTTIVVRTAEPDPYTSNNPGTLLDQVGSEWSGSTYSPIRKDLVHLMTGKSMGGVLGIAWLNAVCTGNRYGLSRSRYTTNVTNRRAVTAHEIGHNFSADHCNGVCNPCQIMCASIGGCGAPVTAFSACEAAGIESYADSRSCLASEPSPITPPFSDMFPSTTLDASKWVFNQGAQVSTNGVNEPSSPNSLQVNAAGNGLYQDDDVRTHFIQMQGVSNPILRYFAQARGVPNGGQLIVEVWTNQLRWVVKNTITSDGVDDTAFTEYTHTLSGTELHNEFRVRFRAVVDSTSHNWYIDNVFVGTNPGAPTGACCVAGVCTVTTEAACGGVWTPGGVCSPNPCEQPTGACCVLGNCTVTTEAGCSGVWTPGAACAPGVCEPVTGACCYASTDDCFIVTEDLCAASGGTFHGLGTTCTINPCIRPTGACCLVNGDCVATTAFDCEELLGEYQGDGASCDVGTCQPQTGACCLTDTCVVASIADCNAQGGQFAGVGTVCGGDVCGPEMGSCCVGSICVIASGADCTAQGGIYGGPNTLCNSAGNNTQPCCRADFDQSGEVEVPDIFGYLSGWFAQSETAEADGVEGISVPDIFAYLSMWFAGCGE